jgi:hypothetical protein
MVILGNMKSRQNQFGSFDCEIYIKADERADKLGFPHSGSFQTFHAHTEVPQWRKKRRKSVRY